MSILVTTGSAVPFDSLVRYLDQDKFKKFDFIFQIGKGKYEPINHEYFSFTDGFDELIEKSELVICHAGAGTVYNLLERQKPFIAVPNFERKNKHQSDICSFLEKQNLGSTVRNFENLETEIQMIRTKKYDNYFNNNEKLINHLLKNC